MVAPTDATQPRVRETRWGPWPALCLEDDALAVTVVPAVGGRVVSLLDHRTGREWLTQGEPPSAAALEAWGAEDSVFGGRQSFGWDECLPTVSVCADPTDPDVRLRDHGDQWGRPSAASVDAAGTLTTTWERSRWPITLARRLTLVGDGVLHADYLLTSRSEQELPILWSLHPTLHLEPGGRVELPGVTATRTTFVSGWPVGPADELPWPTPATGVDLSIVPAADVLAAAKLYARANLGRLVAPDGAWLEVAGEGADTMGVWLDHGAWPLGGPPVHQLALEPTSSPDDQVAEALAHDRAWRLPASGSLTWRVRIASGY
jgi:hypothetical protein